jgi:hypothetical protein
MKYGKKLTEKEIEAFLKGNQLGTLAFAGKRPYAIPMGYIYRKGVLFFGFSKSGKNRKIDCVGKSKRVCFTICKPRKDTPNMKIPCTSLVIEGSLEVVKNRVYYGFPAEPFPDSQMYRLKVSKIGALKCNRKPCELFVQKKTQEKQ